MAKAKSIEQSFDELEEMIAQLEDPTITLEDSFRIYNAGMKVLKTCNDQIDKVEKKLVVINDDSEE